MWLRNKNRNATLTNRVSEKGKAGRALVPDSRNNNSEVTLDKCDNTASFETGWSIVKAKKFDVLRDFCGAIASVFPNTATVESDFSVLGWEKDEYRQSLTDLSLEGIIQCKQFELLSSL